LIIFLVNVNGKVKYSDCVVDQQNHVDSIAKWAMDAGKHAGLVTTTRVTHASPAGMEQKISLPISDFHEKFTQAFMHTSQPVTGNTIERLKQMAVIPPKSKILPNNWCTTTLEKT
jgi:Alkaline phosphatase